MSMPQYPEVSENQSINRHIMSSNIFENLNSPASYEADIDEGWKEVSGKGNNSVQSIFLFLQEVYWDAVMDEIANAILAFDDYKTHVPEGLPELHDGDLRSDYLRELLELWDPLGLSDEAKNELCEVIFQNIKERQNVPQDEIVAAALLQACGFADYDYVQEYRKPTFPSLAQAPVVDSVFPGVFVAVQCSECRFCIRSFHFYECKSGCLDCTFNRNHVKTVPETESGQKKVDHIYLDCMTPTRFRLCCNCLEKSSHPRSHLEVVWRFRKAGDKENHDFARELDTLEDQIKGQGFLAFGNTFLDYLSNNVRRFSSMSSRHVFPAGNAHCAFMFGPLLVENGMTIHPGGALISTRPLPSLGLHSSQDVKEYLNPDGFKTVNGCDVFCVNLHSVSPNRRIYQATKPYRPRRFLCSRKQLSGGLFTDYNSNITWKLGEEQVIQLFAGLAREWRRQKSPIAADEKNKALLKECALYITDTMLRFFSKEINMHLYLIASKLGETQKLTYSRMGNNCQDFCNGLLTFERFLYPTVEVMYPFIPVTIAHDIDREPDDHCLSYLQSFVTPMQYPILGSQSKRAMVGSAVTMYSSFAQNEADLIDHVWSVRFGHDRENSFSLGFRFGSQDADDPYLLKDEEMSCSDRFAASFLPNAQRSGSCTLADHLLDCPVDNLSVLQTHVHRQQKYYSTSDGKLMSNLGPKEWITNRLGVLQRLKLQHDFLAEIAKQFQLCCRDNLPAGADIKTVRKIWRPAETFFSRAWHLDKRIGNTLHFAPDIDFGKGEMSNWKAVGFFTLGTTLFETHRTMLYSRELFNTRLRSLKSLVSARITGKEDTWSPWEWCTCSDCKRYRLEYICCRLDWNYLCSTDADDQTSVAKPGHPDYISTRELDILLKNREDWKKVIGDQKYLLEAQEEHYQSLGAEWETTYLLCLRWIFGADNLQKIQDRLEYYKVVFDGKNTVKKKR